MFLHDQLLAEMQKLQVKMYDLVLCCEVLMSCETSLRLCLYSSRTLFSLPVLQVSSLMSAAATVKHGENILYRGQQGMLSYIPIVFSQ